MRGSVGWAVLVCVLLGVTGAGGGIWLYHRGVQAGSTRAVLEQPSPLPADVGDEAFLRVHVTGAVRRPGVYRLRGDDRVIDAIRLAGGAAPGARLDDLNLAAFLRDGLRLWVPGPRDGPRDEVVVVSEDIYVREPRQPAPSPAGGGPAITAVGATTRAPAPPRASSDRKSLPARPINLNRAGLDELQQLPGVGPEMARRIVAWRATHGRFERPEQLTEVRGIGDKTYAKLAPYVVTE